MTRVVLFLCALAIVGCGRADDQHATSRVTERLLRALEAGDGQLACAQLSAGAVQALEQDEGKPCARAAAQLHLSASAVTRAQVFVTAAKVDLADGESAFLELTRRGWRVDAAGCRPQGGDQPYTCELES